MYHDSRDPRQRFHWSLFCASCRPKAGKTFQHDVIAHRHYVTQSATCLANSTAIQDLFKRSLEQVCLLFIPSWLSWLISSMVSLLSCIRGRRSCTGISRRGWMKWNSVKVRYWFLPSYMHHFMDFSPRSREQCSGSHVSVQTRSFTLSHWSIQSSSEYQQV